ncbi:hypothetical protein ACWDOP_02615 [Nocardia sp. NPDC003693]
MESTLTCQQIVPLADGGWQAPAPEVDRAIPDLLDRFPVAAAALATQLGMSPALG